MSMPALIRIGATLGLFGLLGLTGCGKAGNGASVHGKVMLGGSPLAQGSIRFTPLAGGASVASGADIKDGHYQVAPAKGPSPGRYRVQIDSLQGTGKRFSNPMLPPGQTAEMMENVVAARFNSASELETDIKAGDNEANFNVESK